MSRAALSLLIVTKPKGNNICRKAMLFYSLQKYNLKLVAYILQDDYHTSYQGPVQVGVI